VDFLNETMKATVCKVSRLIVYLKKNRFYQIREFLHLIINGVINLRTIAIAPRRGLINFEVKYSALLPREETRDGAII